MNKIISQKNIPPWKSEKIPIYHIDKTYMENSENGPFFEGPFPKRLWPHQNRWLDFLGYRIASPLGVAAGPLLNSKWIGVAARLGFDILCYKTIRSNSYAGHPLPNVIYIDADKQLDPSRLPNQLRQATSSPQCLETLAITNSFGMPSRSPEYLENDIPLANSQVQTGQIVIVSIVGSPGKSNDKNDFVEDFAATACFAKECGAKVIEANFSCPNVATGEGSIYLHPETVYEIALRIKKAIGTVPLILKVGLFSNPAAMRQMFISAAKAGVQAISGINTISMNVVDSNQNPALGPGRCSSGICGAPIRQAALDFVQQARHINDKEKLGLMIIGGGGITLPQHFDLFFQAGADIAMCATGLMWDPYLAMRYHEMK